MIFHTHQKCFRQCEHFIFGEEAILVLVVQVKEPFYILHEVIKHHSV